MIKKVKENNHYIAIVVSKSALNQDASTLHKKIRTLAGVKEFTWMNIEKREDMNINGTASFLSDVEVDFRRENIIVIKKCTPVILPKDYHEPCPHSRMRNIWQSDVFNSKLYQNNTACVV